jgi:hypothetical protein
VIIKWKVAGEQTVSLSQVIGESASYSNLYAAATALWNKYDVPCASVACTSKAGALTLAANTALAQVRYPGQEDWVVAKNSTFPTRPTYVLAGGALVASQYRAAIGDACDCSTPYIKGTSTYCAVPALSASILALCVKK